MLICGVSIKVGWWPCETNMQAHKWHRGKYNNGTDDSTLRNYRDCYSKDGTNCFQGANGGAPSGGELCLQLQKPDHHTLGHCMKLPSSAYEQWVFTADGKLQVKTQTIDLAAVNSLPYVISAAQPAVIYAMPAEPEQQAVPWRYAAPAGGGHRPVHGWRFDDGGAGKHRLIISRCVCVGSVGILCCSSCCTTSFSSRFCRCWSRARARGRSTSRWERATATTSQAPTIRAGRQRRWRRRSITFLCSTWLNRRSDWLVCV